MKINFSEDGNLVVDVKFEENELEWATNKTDSFDNFINNLKEICITSSNNKKEIKMSKDNMILPTIVKGMETINNISNNLYNYYTDQNGEEVPDLPYK